MIYITGDTHADITRFKHKDIKKLKEGDYLIICGDFGFLWDGSKKEKQILKSLGKKKYSILFVDGCHENYELLNQYEESDWNGGRVRIISGKLMQLMRGYVFKLGDQKIFAFGGGQSSEAEIYRELGKWWSDEIPSDEEIERGRHSLEKVGNVVDYIITHEPPDSLKDFLQIDSKQKSEMSAYFDVVKDTCRFKRWYFGKSHINKFIPNSYHALFTDVVKIL